MQLSREDRDNSRMFHPSNASPRRAACIIDHTFDHPKMISALVTPCDYSDIAGISFARQNPLDRRITGLGRGAWTLLACNVYSSHVGLIYISSVGLSNPRISIRPSATLSRPTLGSKSVVITSETRRSYQLDESI